MQLSDLNWSVYNPTVRLHPNHSHTPLRSHTWQWWQGLRLFHLNISPRAQVSADWWTSIGSSLFLRRVLQHRALASSAPFLLWYLPSSPFLPCSALVAWNDHFHQDLLSTQDLLVQRSRMLDMSELGRLKVFCKIAGAGSGISSLMQQ